MKRLLFSGCEAIILLMVAISFLVTDRLRYVMIVSIPDNINHQDLERNLFLKKIYDDVLNLRRKAIIARERLQIINTKLAECHYTFWGGGSGVIYRKLFASSDMFDFNAFDLNGEIKEDVFNAIWNEYNVKKKIIRSKFDFLSKYLPIAIDMRGLKECFDAGDNNKTSEYLSIIQTNKNWILPSEIPLDERNCPSEKLRDEINHTIEIISSLGKIIEDPSTTPQNVVNVMYSKQFNIDKWYSELGECFERYI